MLSLLNNLNENKSQVYQLEPLTAFEFSKWEHSAKDLSEIYASNQPFEHLSIDNFLPSSLAQQLENDGNSIPEKDWIALYHLNENKFTCRKWDSFSTTTSEIIQFFHSERFVNWLSDITKIKNLIPDPLLEGGGFHRVLQGGYLNIHADFTRHHTKKNWKRRVNVLLYLNENWDESWGGDLEFWDEKMESCIKKYSPISNRLIIFSTSSNTFHGHSSPLACPTNKARNSMALYYYTEEEDKHLFYATHGITNYRAIPTDSFGKILLIRADNIAIRIYTILKRIFGLRDENLRYIFSNIAKLKKFFF